MALVVADSQTTQGDYWYIGNITDAAYVSTDFTAGSSYTLKQIDVYLGPTTGTPTNDYTILLYSDDSGEPDSLLATSSSTIDAGDLSSSEYVWLGVSFAGYSIVSGTTYHIVVSSTVDTSNYVRWGSNPGAGEMLRSADATTWSSLSADQADFRTYYDDAPGGLSIPVAMFNYRRFRQ